MAVPALALSGGGAALAELSSAARDISLDEARVLLNEGNASVCHASWLTRRLGARPKSAPYDILELFAFVHPARVCLPVPAGIARALNLEIPQSAQQAARCLRDAAANLLRTLSRIKPAEQERARNLAMFLMCGLAGAGRPPCCRLGDEVSSAALDVWRGLPEWEDEPAPAPQGQEPIAGAEAQARLIALIGASGNLRRQQQDFTSAAAGAFAPRARVGSPNIVLAEAGTGTGERPSVTWRRFRCGRKRMVHRFGFRPLRATCSARSFRNCRSSRGGPVDVH